MDLFKNISTGEFGKSTEFHITLIEVLLSVDPLVGYVILILC
jgi:hypothetical protein